MSDKPFPVTVGGRRPKSKGNRAEAEVANMLRAHGWVQARRNLGSGGYGGNDLVDGPEGVAWEIKRVESLNVQKAMDQCVAAAKPSDIPVVAHRRSNCKWLATLPLEDLIALLEIREWAE